MFLHAMFRAQFSARNASQWNWKQMKQNCFTVLICSLSLLLAAPIQAADDLMEMSLEELANLTITSASKKEQNLQTTPAAVFVLTSEDIRRSGMTSIPELLRLVPGLQVARMASHRYAISSRGFNSQFANKLLVLIDGRSVYTPNFSGVWWDVQDVALEDVERIEVIRGPGGVTWGANAVGGVINIITKEASKTQGTLVSAGYGTHNAIGTVRYGGSIGDDFHYRAYAKAKDQDRFRKGNEPEGEDKARMFRGGFRTDWQATEKDKLTFQGDIYDGYIKDLYTYNMDFSGMPVTKVMRNKTDGFNLLTRWSHKVSDTSDFQLQFYYDRANRFLKDFTDSDETDTYDVDFSHRFALGERQEIQWGGGWRYVRTDMGQTLNVDYGDDLRTDHVFSGFIQDEVDLIPDLLKLSFGTKVEHNNYTDWELQPSVRLAATPSEHHTVWAAVSRAVRTPARTAEDLDLLTTVIPGLPPTAIRILGNPGHVESERVYAYELGYKAIVTEQLSADIAVFYNDLNKIQTFEARTPYFDVATGTVLVPMVFDNNASGYSAGVELTMQWRPVDWLRLIGNYTFERTHLSLRHTTDSSMDEYYGQDPNHQASLRAQVDLPWSLELDTALFYVSNLHVSTMTMIDVPSYVRWDMRLGWKPTENWEVSLFGENLNDARHREYGGAFGFSATHVPRAVYAQLTYRR